MRYVCRQPFLCHRLSVTLSSGSSSTSPIRALPESTVPVRTVPCPRMAKQWSMENLNGPDAAAGCAGTCFTISCMSSCTPWACIGASAVPMHKQRNTGYPGIMTLMLCTLFTTSCMSSCMPYACTAATAAPKQQAVDSLATKDMWQRTCELSIFCRDLLCALRMLRCFCFSCAQTVNFCRHLGAASGDRPLTHFILFTQSGIGSQL